MFNEKWLRSAAGILAAVTMAAGLATPSFGQSDWPNAKTTRIIVPGTAGGSLDVPTRIAAEALAKETGGTFILVHKPGAGGSVGTQALLSSPADGYTFLLVSSASTIAPYLYPKTVGNPNEQLVPISLITEVAVAISVPVESEIQSLEQLIEEARKEPRKFSFGTGGIGSGNHLAAASLEQQVGIEMVHIPYGGVSAAGTGMLSGEVDMTFTSVSSASRLAKSGQSRILAVGSSARLEDFPDIPTIGETVPGFIAGNWFGFVGAAGFPEDVRDKIQETLAKIPHDPTAMQSGRNAGLNMKFSGPAPLAGLIESGYAKHGVLLKQLGIGPR